MNILQFVTIGEHKGKSRVYFDGGRLAQAFTIGEQYAINVKDNGTVTLSRAESGKKVSRRKTGENYKPVIDCRDDIWGKLFGIGSKLRAVIRAGEIILSRPNKAKRQEEREQRFFNKAAKGQPFKFASLFSGGQIMDNAIMTGLKNAGVRSYVSFSCEREGRFMDLALANQSEHHRGDTVMVNGNIEDIDLNHHNASADILVAGIPCTGASQAGITSNKLKYAEEHDSAGGMSYYFLRCMDVFQPAIAIVENVTNYLKTASFAIIKAVLRDMGYNVSFGVKNGNDFGALENRDRMVMIAVSSGLGAVDVSDITPVATQPKQIRDILEPVPLDDASWKTYDYLDAKRVRDKAAGKGFSRDILNGGESKCKVIREGYHKGGSTETFVQHPTEPTLSRLFTAKEAAAVKEIPFSLLKGESRTTQLRVSGQSVIYTLFVAVGEYLGQWCSSILSDKAMTMKVA